MSNLNEKAIKSIDGLWPLEGFVTQKNAAASMNWGFIGIGQGGSKIVDAFASIRSPKTGDALYPCMAINSNLGDMRSLRNIPEHRQFPLRGYENGCGKNPDVGKKAFMDNGERIFDAIGNIMGRCDIIFVAAASGGGTGAGSINVLTDAIADYLGKPVIAITALPRPDEIESLNAYNSLAELAPKLTEYRGEDENIYRALQSIVILDNEMIVHDHMTDPEVSNLTWDFYSNYKIASVLHEWNVVTSLESHITLDAADLQNHIMLTGGALTFAKKKINLDEMKSKEDLIEQIISTYRGKNVLANGFNYGNDMRSMGLVVVMPRERAEEINQDTLEIIRTRIKEELPNVAFYPGFVTSNSTRHAIVLTMASINGLPERASNLRKEAEELRNARIERDRQASGFNLGEKIANRQVAATSSMKQGSNPFAKGNNASVEQKKPNPFRKP